MKKEESIVSNSTGKALEDEGYPFKKINGDDTFVEDDWYEPRGTYSLRYHYSRDGVQHILEKHAENWGAAKKEIIDLTGDSD